MLRRADAATATVLATSTATRSAVAARRRPVVPLTVARGLSDSGRFDRSHPSRRFRVGMFTSMLHPRARGRERGGALSLSLSLSLSLPLSSTSICDFGSLGSGVRWCGRRQSSSAARVVFTAPPEDLEEGFFERPTPLLLVAGEGQPATWWNGAASFFAARGCTVGTMPLTGRGSSPTETLSLRALQAGVAAAVETSGLTPPVIVAHSMAGFVCQQYLQSYSASGLVLLDSFPPTPSGLAIEHLKLASARAGDPHLPETPTGLTRHEIAQLMKDDPVRWEGLLRAHFEEFHRHSPFTAEFMRGPACPDGDGDVSQEEPSPDVSEVDGCGDGEVGLVDGGGQRFPAKAFAQMCLGQPSSTLRLESHVVKTLVLGSVGFDVGVGDGLGNSKDDAPAGAGDGSRGSGDCLVALNSARRDALEAICEFHGTQGWSPAGRTGVAGSEKAESLAPWQEVVWDWYDARF